MRVLLNALDSEWFPVSTGIPPRSFSEPILFTTDINNLETWKSKFTISNFGNNTKISRRADSQIIQNYLYQIVHWSEIWHISFSLNKCKVMYARSRNSVHTYNISRRTLLLKGFVQLDNEFWNYSVWETISEGILPDKYAVPRFNDLSFPLYFLIKLVIRMTFSAYSMQRRGDYGVMNLMWGYSRCAFFRQLLTDA